MFISLSVNNESPKIMVEKILVGPIIKNFEMTIT